MINEAKEREAFEAWAAKEPYQLERRRDVYYASDTWHAHHGYIARARVAAEDAEKWLPIEQMKREDMESAKLFILWSPSTHTYTCQGRYWMQHNEWQDEDGNRMEPTHFHKLLPPPAAAQEGGGV